MKADKKKLRHIELIVYHWSYTIALSKDTIKALNKPEYITIRVNPTLCSIAVFPCSKNDPMSFEVPPDLFTNHKCCFRIYSKGFKEWIQMLIGGKNKTTYAIEGKYSEKNNLVYFPIGNARIRDLHNREYNECRFQSISS